MLGESISVSFLTVLLMWERASMVKPDKKQTGYIHTNSILKLLWQKRKESLHKT